MQHMDRSTDIFGCRPRLVNVGPRGAQISGIRTLHTYPCRPRAATRPRTYILTPYPNICHMAQVTRGRAESVVRGRPTLLSMLLAAVVLHMKFTELPLPLCARVPGRVLVARCSRARDGLSEVLLEDTCHVSRGGGGLTALTYLLTPQRLLTYRPCSTRPFPLMYPFLMYPFLKPRGATRE